MSKKIYKFYKTKKNNSLKKTKKYKIQNGGGPKMYQIPSGKTPSKLAKGLAYTWALGKTGVKELIKTIFSTTIMQIGQAGIRKSDGSATTLSSRKSVVSTMMKNDPELKNILKQIVLRKDKTTPYTNNELQKIRNYFKKNENKRTSRGTARSYVKSKETFKNKVEREAHERLYGKKTLYGNTGKYDAFAHLQRVLDENPLPIVNSLKPGAVQTTIPDEASLHNKLGEYIQVKDYTKPKPNDYLSVGPEIDTYNLQPPLNRGNKPQQFLNELID